jgi:hypothetical protein
MNAQVEALKNLVVRKPEIPSVLFAVFFWVVIWPHIHIFSGSWSYRMTVEVETPEGIKTGSAVREISWGTDGLVFFIPIPSMGARTWSEQGEAVAVDLGKHGILFALITSPDVYADPVFEELQKDARAHNLKFPKLGTEKVLELPDYPLIARFRDLKNPDTLEIPYESSWENHDPRTRRIYKDDHMEDYFGAGVRLKKITVEVVDDPATWGIEKYLPWVLTAGDGNISGGITARNFRRKYQ